MTLLRWISFIAVALTLASCGSGGDETSPIATENATSLTPLLGTWSQAGNTNCYTQTDPNTNQTVYVKSDAVAFTASDWYWERMRVFTDSACTLYSHDYVSLYSITWKSAAPSQQVGDLTAEMQGTLLSVSDENGIPLIPFSFTGNTFDSLVSIYNDALYIGSLDWSSWVSYSR